MSVDPSGEVAGGTEGREVDGHSSVVGSEELASDVEGGVAGEVVVTAASVALRTSMTTAWLGG